jgi:uncharacterized delta-60 repeat protein
LDTGFSIGTGFNNTVNSIAVQGDGKILVGGTFTSYNGTSRNRIGRLNSDGSLDTGFSIGTGFPTNAVNSIAVQGDDGKILVGGSFTSYNGTTRNRIARLNSDGSFDTGFSIGTGFNSAVNSIAVQGDDGKILVGGTFTSYNGGAAGSSNRIARLNSDGTLDSGFSIGTGFDDSAEASDWLQTSTGAATALGTSSSYFEGNIRTCADKGMRLPTMYETTMTDPGATHKPTGDSITPFFVTTNGVPSLTSWTRTASTSSSTADHYWSWSETVGFSGYLYSDSSLSVRCVLPSATAFDTDIAGSRYNGAQDLTQGYEIPGPGGTTLTLQYANGTNGFKIWKEKGGNRILNAKGVVADGWQKQLNRAGTAFSATDFTAGANIAGRVCPPNVFLSHSNMTATGRCLYYDAGNAAQALNAATGTVAEDFLLYWNNTSTGRGASSSFYEGNIKTCADKGMRLPVLYETTAQVPQPFTSSGPMLPNGDGINPTYAASNGVPSMADWTWTASGDPGAFHYGGGYIYHLWKGSSFPCDIWGCEDATFLQPVRCVLP